MTHVSQANMVPPHTLVPLPAIRGPKAFGTGCLSSDCGMPTGDTVRSAADLRAPMVAVTYYCIERVTQCKSSLITAGGLRRLSRGAWRGSVANFHRAGYEEGGKTILATLKPTTLLAVFDTPQLKGVAQEVEDTIVNVMKATVAG